MDEHFVGTVAQKAIIDRGDGRVLITRDERDPDAWELPGGRLHKDEDPKDGLVREVREELGIEIIVRAPIAATQFLHVREQVTALLITWAAALVGSPDEVVPRGGEVAEVDWVGADELEKRPLFPEYHGVLTSYFMRL
ncbi:NUDIX domain-containing protein [Patescibacteria group bacterium]|jgi:8-oxo-dGTP diphosphatase|nr:NUDIX domain-containing protein [Patescibacteria group bacterium]